MFWPHMGGWGGWMTGGLVILLVIGLIIALVVLLMRSGNSSSRREIGPNQALELLKQRYARGEITREEYEEIRRELQT